MMNISSFDDLLKAARLQALPQRLLFVFASAVLPEDSTPQQRADFEAGQGGALVPMMCVDKSPRDIDSFENLSAQADALNQPWVIVFAAAMSGTVGFPPSSDDAKAPLDAMVQAIKAGEFDGYVPFNRQGEPVTLGRCAD
jgi:hypothetical protein